MKILVVEDDVSVCRLVSLILRSEGHEVSTAQDGLDGLQKLQREEPELIVLDLFMPNLDGRTFVNITRDMGCRSRVIIMSAYGATSAADELHADGAVDKPFDPEDLLREVERLEPPSRGPPPGSRGRAA